MYVYVPDYFLRFKTTTLLIMCIYGSFDKSCPHNCSCDFRMFLFGTCNADQDKLILIRTMCTCILTKLQLFVFSLPTNRITYLTSLLSVWELSGNCTITTFQFFSIDQLFVLPSRYNKRLIISRTLIVIKYT